MQTIKLPIPTKSAFTHLRITFSLFLSPVYFFVLSQATVVNINHAALVFFIWNFLVYPASNGYNSYYDKDDASIGLLKNPPKVDVSLYYLSLFLDVVALAASFFVSWKFAAAIFLYGIVSKLYSHPSVRLKKLPIISFLTVSFFQGAFVYWSTYIAISGGGLDNFTHQSFILAGVICSCLIGASYPLTQIYQHREDKSRGDITISLFLGLKSTFIFSGSLFVAASILLYAYMRLDGVLNNFYLFLICNAPVTCFFIAWWFKVIRSDSNANFINAMRMNFISAACILVYFGILIAKSTHIYIY